MCCWVCVCGWKRSRKLNYQTQCICVQIKFLSKALIHWITHIDIMYDAIFCKRSSRLQIECVDICVCTRLRFTKNAHMKQIHFIRALGCSRWLFDMYKCGDACGTLKQVQRWLYILMNWMQTATTHNDLNSLIKQQERTHNTFAYGAACG